MDRKYKLIKSDIKGVYRVKALRDFGDVKKFDIGGYVQSEHNLSHDGDCWIYDDARVFGNARINNNSEIHDTALIWDNARVYGCAIIADNARVLGNAQIEDNAKVFGNAKVFDDANVYEHAIVRGYSYVYGEARIFDNAKIDDNAKVFDRARIGESAIVYNNAKVFGNAIIYGDAQINKGKHIGTINENFKDIIYIQCKKRLITVYRDINNIIKCNIGCQSRMTLEDLLQRIEKDGGMNEHREEYVRIMQNAHLLLG